MKLNELRDNPGARKKKRLLGRGMSSGLGKTCGRGGKGQTARSGVRLKGFQGGQMPLSRRLPKVGFTNIHRLSYVVVNLVQIEEALELGKLDKNNPITMQHLKSAGIFKHMRDGVRLLGNGVLTHKIHLVVSGASQTAIKAVEEQGGTITLENTKG